MQPPTRGGAYFLGAYLIWVSEVYMSYIAPHAVRWATAWVALSCTVLLSASCLGNMNLNLNPRDSGQASGANAAINAGLSIPSVTVHRLNRFEYNNTVRDLLGTTQTPGDTFPVDPVSNGFDNAADTLTLSPQLVGLYNTAARSLADEITTPQPRWSKTFLAPALGLTANPQGSPLSNWGWNIKGQFNVTLAVPQDDTATLTVLVGGQATNAPIPTMSIQVDGQPLSGDITVNASMAAPQSYSVQTSLTAGNHQISVVFTNKVIDNGTTSSTDSEMALGQIVAASTTVTVSAPHKLLYVCDPNTAADPAVCWRSIVTGFQSRAIRRPLTNDEINSNMALFNNLSTALGADLAFNYMVRTTLLSPDFIYRASRPGVGQADGTTLLDDYDFASRLSYFVWGSMPDKALLDAAGSGGLRTLAGVRAQVTRMLADAKVQGLIDGFAGQWLGTRALDTAVPDPNTFPSYDAALKAAFIGEANLFFGDYLSNHLAVSSMLQPDFGFLNDRLAAHYNLPAPNSSTVVRTPRAPTDRRGLLTQGGWLTANSVQTRSSPVKRGRFILENLLCKVVPAPPPGIPPLPEGGSGQPQTQRQVLGTHVSAASCAACHNLIDPPGFAVEVFDGIGAARTLDNGLPIDATGSMNGTAFNGAAQLAPIIAADPTFEQCVTRQLFTYAMQRGITADDATPLQDLFNQFDSGGHRLDAMILAITTSSQFRLAPNK